MIQHMLDYVIERMLMLMLIDYVIERMVIVILKTMSYL